MNQNKEAKKNKAHREKLLLGLELPLSFCLFVSLCAQHI